MSVFVRVLRQYPAITGRGLWCVCSCTAFGFVPPFVAGVCGVAFWAWDEVFRFTPSILLWMLGCVCLCVCSASTPPFLAGVCGVFVDPMILALLCHLLLVCLLWFSGCGFGFFASACQCWRGFGVCVFVLRSTCSPQIFDRRVRCECVRLGLDSSCDPPFLAGVLGCVCLCARFA